MTTEPYNVPPFSDPTPQVGDEGAAPLWGAPPTQTQVLAGQTYQTTTSLLQQMLSFSGMNVPAETMATSEVYGADYSLPAPGTGGDNFTRGFLHGVSDQDRQMAAATGQMPADSLGDDRVYMGHTEDTKTAGSPAHIGLPGETDADLASVGTTETKHKTTTVQAALNQPYLWSDDKVAETMKKMRAAGLNVTSFDEMMGAWQSLVTRASRTLVLSGGDNLVTPWDMLAATKKENVANGTLDGNGNIVHTSTSTSVNTLSEGQAWSTLRGTMQQMLGRDPTDQEVRDFLSAANADAARDPSKTVSTTTTNAESGTSNTSSHTTGGYTSSDAAQSAYDNLHDSADYGKYQSATTYFNAMISALGEVAGSA